MATNPQDKAEDSGGSGLNGPALPLPGGGDAPGGNGGQAANVVKLYISQCVEGGWQREGADGRTLRVDSTFAYGINLEFESAEKAKAFMARPDLDQISNTMMRTMETMAQETLGLEVHRDFLPESYPDGQIPDNVHRQFTPNTVMDMNIVAQDFADVMRATYPDSGLTGATLDEGSVNQLPGCYYGIPDDLATAPNADEKAVGLGTDTRAQSFRF